MNNVSDDIDNLSRPIEELGFTNRTLDVLHKEHINYVGHLIQQTEFELIRIPNLGRKTLTEIKEVLAEHGLNLAFRINRDIPDTPKPARINSEKFLRDHFAGLAMQVIWPYEDENSKIARLAYAMADRMIEERNAKYEKTK